MLGDAVGGEEMETLHFTAQGRVVVVSATVIG
jgi:hypothetical protein